MAFAATAVAVTVGGGSGCAPADRQGRAADRPPPPGTLRFVEVTAATGLPALGQTSGAALVDLDGDGRLDLLLGRHAELPAAYRNLGQLRFARLDGWGEPLEVFDHHATLVEDLDGDGRPDFYFVVGAHRGEGLGCNALALSSEGFAGDAAGRWGVQDRFGRGRGVLALDLDGDGALELLALNHRTAPRAYRLAPLSAPAIDRAGELFGVPPADDAGLGAALAHGEPTSELRQRTAFLTALHPQDLDEDGRPDFLALGAPPVRILRYQAGAYRLDPAALPPEAYVPAPAAAAWGDFDGDGLADLYLAGNDADAASPFGGPRRNHLLLRRQEAFVPAPDSLLTIDGSGVACAAEDLDNDGRLDLAVLQANRSRANSRLRLFHNRGQAGFAAAAPLAEEPGLGEGLLVADLDGDGDLDILALMGAIGIGDPGGGIRLYRNEQEGGRWLDVVLTGSPASTYGATVEVTAGQLVQRRQYWPRVVCGSAFPAPLHFGLGGAGKVDRVVVRWPSGERTVRRGLAVDGTVDLGR